MNSALFKILERSENGIGFKKGKCMVCNEELNQIEQAEQLNAHATMHVARYCISDFYGKHYP